MGTLICKHKLLFYLLLILLMSCDSNKDNEEIYPNIRFVYMEKCVETFNAITDPNHILISKACVDTVITNKEEVQTFMSLVNGLQNDTSRNSIDIRVVAVVSLNDSTQSVVSFGDFWGTMVDGSCKIDNKELFDFINCRLYDETGWRKLIVHSLGNEMEKVDVNDPEIQKEIERSLSWVREHGFLFSTFSSKKSRKM